MMTERLAGVAATREPLKVALVALPALPRVKAAAVPLLLVTIPPPDSEPKFCAKALILISAVVPTVTSPATLLPVPVAMARPFVLPSVIKPPVRVTGPVKVLAVPGVRVSAPKPALVKPPVPVIWPLMVAVVNWAFTVKVGAMPFKFMPPARVTWLFVCASPRLRLVPVALKMVGSEIVKLAFVVASWMLPLKDKAPAVAFTPSAAALPMKIEPPFKAHVREAALAFGRIREPAPVFVITAPLPFDVVVPTVLVVIWDAMTKSLRERPVTLSVVPVALLKFSVPPVTVPTVPVLSFAAMRAAAEDISSRVPTFTVGLVLPPELLSVRVVLKRLVPTKVRTPLPLMVMTLVEAICPWLVFIVTVAPPLMVRLPGITMEPAKPLRLVVPPAY